MRKERTKFCPGGGDFSCSDFGSSSSLPVSHVHVNASPWKAQAEGLDAARGPSVPRHRWSSCERARLGLQEERVAPRT